MAGMGDQTKTRHINKVSHPYVQVLVLLMSGTGVLGGGSGFWLYLQHREAGRKETTRAVLEAKYELKDLEKQLAALVEMLAEQGNQLKQFKGVLEQLTNGHRVLARKAVQAVDIPLEQGKLILRGRAVPSYDDVESAQRLIADELEQLEALQPDHKE